MSFCCTRKKEKIIFDEEIISMCAEKIISIYDRRSVSLQIHQRGKMQLSSEEWKVFEVQV